MKPISAWHASVIISVFKSCGIKMKGGGGNHAGAQVYIKLSSFVTCSDRFSSSTPSSLPLHFCVAWAMAGAHLKVFMERKW